MDLRILQAFIRVAELGSIARAASVLNQTQPTISRQITLLEQEVGGALFIRHRRGMRLSIAGEQFRDQATLALRGLEQAKADFAARAGEPAGTVSLGVPGVVFLLSARIDFCAQWTGGGPFHQGIPTGLAARLRGNIAGTRGADAKRRGRRCSAAGRPDVLRCYPPPLSWR